MALEMGKVNESAMGWYEVGAGEERVARGSCTLVVGRWDLLSVLMFVSS